jgi:hypothetical protein
MIFQKLLIVSVGADILGDWQGGGYDSGYTQGRIPKTSVTPLSIRGEYDAVSVRLLIGVCQCQLLTKSKRCAHIILSLVLP